MTTLLKQYLAIKAKYADAVLLFRVGDFYESFNEDAEIVSNILRITLVLTKQDPGIKLCASLPHFTLDIALNKLVKAGYKVGICEQLDAPKAGVMKRGITGVFPE